MKRFIIMTAFLLILSACSGKSPDIIRNEWMLNYVNDVTTESRQEELSCFLLINDPDGNDDIQALYLINNDKELYWEIPEELWVEMNAGTNRWFGFNRFIPAEEKFESGSYHVQAVDKAGLITETRLYIPNDRLNLEGIVFPDVSVRNSSITINGSYPKYLLWFYDTEDRLISSRYLRNGTFTLTELMDNRQEPKPEYFWVLVFIESRYSAIKSGPYKINR